MAGRTGGADPGEEVVSGQRRQIERQRRRVRCATRNLDLLGPFAVAHQLRYREALIYLWCRGHGHRRVIHPGHSSGRRQRRVKTVRGCHGERVSVGLQFLGKCCEVLPVGPDLRPGVGHPFEAAFREQRQHRLARVTSDDARTLRHDKCVVGDRALHHRRQLRHRVPHRRHTVHPFQDDTRRPVMCQRHCRDCGSGKRQSACPLWFHLPDCPWFLVVDRSRVPPPAGRAACATVWCQAYRD